MYISRKESLNSDQYHWNEQLPLTSNRWTDEKDQDILYVHFSASKTDPFQKYLYEKKTNKQTMIDNTLHVQINIEQHEPH
jgi:hypothetical protein